MAAQKKKSGKPFSFCIGLHSQWDNSEDIEHEDKYKYNIQCRQNIYACRKRVNRLNVLDLK